VGQFERCDDFSARAGAAGLVPDGLNPVWLGPVSTELVFENTGKDHEGLNPFPARADLCDTRSMPKRSSSIDPYVLAAAIVRAATNGHKNPAAVMLGRMGGLKGGRARADALSPKRRSDIAKKAARARWSNGS